MGRRQARAQPTAWTPCSGCAAPLLSSMPCSQPAMLPAQGGDALGEEASADANADRLVRDALSRAHAALPPAKSPARTPRCVRDPNLHERTYEVRICSACRAGAGVSPEFVRAVMTCGCQGVIAWRKVSFCLLRLQLYSLEAAPHCRNMQRAGTLARRRQRNAHARLRLASWNPGDKNCIKDMCRRRKTAGTRARAPIAPSPSRAPRRRRRRWEARAHAASAWTVRSSSAGAPSFGHAD